MSKVALIAAVFCIVMAVAVFVFAEGLRRWYSGLLFAVMALVMLVNTLRWQRFADEQQDDAEGTPTEDGDGGRAIG